MAARACGPGRLIACRLEQDPQLLGQREEQRRGEQIQLEQGGDHSGQGRSPPSGAEVRTDYNKRASSAAGLPASRQVPPPPDAMSAVRWTMSDTSLLWCSTATGRAIPSRMGPTTS